MSEIQMNSIMYSFMLPVRPHWHVCNSWCCQLYIHKCLNVQHHNTFFLIFTFLSLFRNFSCFPWCPLQIVSRSYRFCYLYIYHIFLEIVSVAHIIHYVSETVPLMTCPYSRWHLIAADDSRECCYMSEDLIMNFADLRSRVKLLTLETCPYVWQLSG